jgi:drug/metabolite transporter (DMT)-like permease
MNLAAGGIMNKSSNIGAKAALFGATLIWGSSFLIVKNSMNFMQPHMLLAFRFTVGCLLLGVIFHKKLKLLNKDYFIKGGIIGLCLFLGYSLQTIGITDTTPGKNAFLTTVYCVLVPFLFWLVDKKKPDVFNISAALITILGVGLVSLNGDLSIRAGDAFTLAGGIAFAFHIVAVTKFGRDKDPILLTILQFGYAAVISWVVALTFEDFPTQWNVETMAGLFYLAVFATAVALLLQNIGQKYTNPAPASIILSLESVFGVLFSVIFYREQITGRLFFGFLLIFAAVIISETKLSFIFKNKIEEVSLEDSFE